MYKLTILGPVKWRFESRAMIETRSFGHHRCSVKRKTSKKDSVFWQRQSPAKSHFLVLQSLFPPILHKTIHPSSHVMLLRRSESLGRCVNTYRVMVRFFSILLLSFLYVTISSSCRLRSHSLFPQDRPLWLSPI